MGKFLIGVLTGMLCHTFYEVMAGPKLLKARLDKWTSKEDEEKYPSLHRYWDSKTENPEYESEN